MRSQYERLSNADLISEAEKALEGASEKCATLNSRWSRRSAELSEIVVEIKRRGLSWSANRSHTQE
jgi:hypothetical protein